MHDSLFLGHLRIPPACIRSPEERTLFKSLGIAVEDLAAGHHIWRKAESLDVGELGGDLKRWSLGTFA